MINKKVIYAYRGKDYSNCHDICTAIENKIGTYIDEVDRRAGYTMGANLKLELLNMFTDPDRYHLLVAAMQEFQESKELIKTDDQ